MPAQPSYRKRHEKAGPDDLQAGSSVQSAEAYSAATGSGAGWVEKRP
jgi:hypothetical protein